MTIHWNRGKGEAMDGPQGISQKTYDQYYLHLAICNVCIWLSQGISQFFAGLVYVMYVYVCMSQTDFNLVPSASSFLSVEKKVKEAFDTAVEAGKWKVTYLLYFQLQTVMYRASTTL
jgi:hypothetical protein